MSEELKKLFIELSNSDYVIGVDESDIVGYTASHDFMDRLEAAIEKNRATPWIKFDPEDESTWPEESCDVVVYPAVEYCDYHDHAFFNRRKVKFEMCVFTGYEHEDVVHDYVSHWRHCTPDPEIKEGE